MEKFHPHSSIFEPATYKISILGTLDKKWSDYVGGMAIEHTLVLQQYPMTMLTGIVADQAALIGILNSLYDLDCPIITVECVEDAMC